MNFQNLRKNNKTFRQLKKIAGKGWGRYPGPGVVFRFYPSARDF